MEQVRGCTRILLPSLALILGACSFDTSTTGFGAGSDAAQGADGSAADASGQATDASTIDGAQTDALPVDASVDATPDAEPDAACVFDVVELCALTPDGSINLTGSFDTDSDPLCRSFTPSGGEPTCLVLADSVSVGDLSVEGSLPLVLAATGKMELSGLFDISSQRGGQTGAGANFSGCSATSNPQNDRGGAGGGAGGSFAGTGGDGGTGDTDTSLGNDGNGAPGIAGAAVGIPSFVRGGCNGSRGGHEGNQGDQGKGGRGGAGGGAVHFVSGGDFVLLSGAVIRATGAGGRGGEVQSGGGGGGSGGFVRMDAVNVILDGNISANGGGGGEGGLRLNGNPVTGNVGQDGTVSAGGAAGGSGAATSAGDGGAGSLMTNVNASGGSSAIGGAGGGGGAGGYIIVDGVQSGSGLSSPALTIL